MTDEHRTDSTVASTPPITPLLTEAALDEAAKKVKDRTAAEDATGTLAPPPTKDEARTFAREFLLGELIKSTKLHFVKLTKPFSQLKEFEQEQLLRRVQNEVESAVRETIEIIAGDARLTFKADVESVTFKDGVKAVLKLGKSEHAHVLADQAGKAVMVVIEDFARYLDPGDAAKPEPDQRPLFDKSRGEAEKIASGGEKPKPRRPKAKGPSAGRKAKKK